MTRTRALDHNFRMTSAIPSNPIHYDYYYYYYAYAFIWFTLTIYFIIQMAKTIYAHTCIMAARSHTHACRAYKAASSNSI